MTSTEVGGNSELVGIIVAFVVLLITFGSVIAAGLPIISALIGLASGEYYQFVNLCIRYTKCHTDISRND